ncbi:MAG: response regulator transcription factor [Micrococcales bacterium]|nr:response regulator transcription factor [Micrococcales bacterium]
MGSPEAADRPVTLAVANDFELVVRGVARMLEDHGDRVAVVELNCQTPVAQEVDLVLLDTFAQQPVDQQAVREALGNPKVGRVAIYTWHLDEHLIQDALAQGVHGYLYKGLSAEQLVGAIERVHAGDRVVSRARRSQQDGETSGGDWPGRNEGLTEREADVLALIAQGMSNEAIARQMYLSINTVKSYVRSAYRRMGVASRSQAVLWAVEHGFNPSSKRITGSPRD